MPQFEIQFDIVAIILLSSTVLVFLYKKVFKPIITMYKKLINELKLLEASRIKIDSIYNELHPNGGTSLRDAINRIDKRLVQVEVKQNVYLMDSPQGIYETDSTGNCTGVNRTYLRMVGRTEKEILGRGWVYTISDEWKERVISTWDDAISHKMEFVLQYDVVTPAGETFTVQGSAVPMESPGTKEIIGWLGTITKIASK